MEPEAQTPTAVFTEHRELLFGIVYAMLGTVADTEDVLQETWLSWEARSHGSPIGHPRAYLVRVAVNAAIARQAAIRRRRETYIGPWLPEPLASAPDPIGDRAAREGDGADRVLLVESVSLALMVVLESLTPAERAVFVLADVFGYGHNEIAAMLDRTPAAVRQTAHRARAHVQARRPKYAVDPAVHRQVTERFMAAVSGGDLDALIGLMAPDVELTCDGGGLAPAAGPRPMHGPERIAAFLVGRVFRRGEGLAIGFRPVNGSPSALMVRDGATVGVLMLDLRPEDGAVTGVYAVTNPEKLTRLR
ncbi:RNA polymerase sigma-70 factor, ECF subfamily [Glycomyces sambucus]|uniref:RNA polymerase sigma-70 factor, ECF subfamily n=1 Tax=Glycomyces sambucus TaxID=380244 RepID=A0A1G9EYL2_9ACTN|nr:sigma-70 family RNA polymerase sigma factor [Glycomyces sambucus]SDK81244.1 RNA polymerase sigma-70 factor, ECF subfamily [Glycomyces sambucus]